MQQWWETDQYLMEEPIPAQFTAYAGPEGIATVKAFEDGRTSKGWGEKKFMGNYMSGKFNVQIAKIGWLSKRWDFAFVMRSMRLVCIDIDGKNGGLEHAGKLGMLPLTLAETSRSGDGYHLFYSVDDHWDPEKGYAKFKDRIGVVQGVDIRSVGCVYHVPGQKWNDAPISALPKYLDQRWTADAVSGEAQVEEIIALLTAGDEDQLLVMQDALIKDLSRPIPAGRRNTTLYAIGVKLQAAGVPQWEQHISNRGQQLKLDLDEVAKIVSNIKKYR